MILPSISVVLTLIPSLWMSGSSGNQSPPETPPVGTYVCYYYGYNYALMSSSLTQVRVLPKHRLEIVGETVRFKFDPATSVLTLAGGKFKGATAKYQLDSSKKSALVFSRKKNEARGHKIDVSDTWCYLETKK